MNVIKTVRMYDSDSCVVYPKYSMIDLDEDILSGFREHSVHLYIGFGIFGPVLHGMIGIKIEVINAVAEMIPEYINFFFNCIFLYGFCYL
ncbi:MAG: hypothetical protein KJ592_00040 [Nanoarchaeota archaeon]|nr:hypothetical protein [Nanoarchaeota archaeon]